MPHQTVPSQQQRPNFQMVFKVPKQTQLEQAGDTCLRQSECPCKCAQILSGAPAGVDGNPSASDSQPDPVPA